MCVSVRVWLCVSICDIHRECVGGCTHSLIVCMNPQQTISICDSLVYVNLRVAGVGETVVDAAV